MNAPARLTKAELDRMANARDGAFRSAVVQEDYHVLISHIREADRALADLIDYAEQLELLGREDQLHRAINQAIAARLSDTTDARREGE